MKYAITSTGNTIDSAMDRRFGRCAYAMLYDTENGEMEFVSNPFRDHDDEVGPKLVELLAGRGVRKIISGSFGFRIKPLLDSKKIQMIVPGNSGITLKELVGLIQDRL
ncbi:MAG: hypothetical protein K9G38_01935 [Bacteroidales bacterium]|nr:hypothetical protein [Bacteroidales bacterium]